MRLLDWRSRRRRPARVGLPASDLVGVTPDGSPVQVTMDGLRAELYFLTSSCYGCRVLWEAFSARPRRPTEPALVVITPSPETESAREVQALAPPHVPVVMSSEAWHANAVTRAPWRIVVADGVVVADGPAPVTWP
jgi:hypothetical protein